jgi:hypothetical protein
MALILNRRPGRRVALLLDDRLLGFVDPQFNRDRPGTVDLHFEFEKDVVILREELLLRAADQQQLPVGVGEAPLAGEY